MYSLSTQSRLLRVLAVWLFILVANPAGSLRAEAAAPVAPVAASAPPRAAHTLAAWSAWTKFWTFVEWAVGDRKRMIRFAAVGMCLALFFLIRR